MTHLHFRTPEEALTWALGELDDLLGFKEHDDDTPDHECDFYLNPEKGGCDFHEKYHDAKYLANDKRPDWQNAQEIREAECEMIAAADHLIYISAIGLSNESFSRALEKLDRARSKWRSLTKDGE